MANKLTIVKRCVVITTCDGCEHVFEIDARCVSVVVTREGPEVIYDQKLLNTRLEPGQIRQIVVDGRIDYFNKLVDPH